MSESQGLSEPKVTQKSEETINWLKKSEELDNTLIEVRLLMAKRIKEILNSGKTWSMDDMQNVAQLTQLQAILKS